MATQAGHGRVPSSSTPAISIPIVRSLLLLIGHLPLLHAAPLFSKGFSIQTAEEQPLPAQDAALWIYLAVAAVLVVVGGAFAGLTIALMGQDEIYLQVIKTSGERFERRNAARVLRLLGRGKHWVLVTLLLGNVITNETLPIVLDRSLGGGWPAVLGSTVLIVIFGEIIPQSVCVRFGLPIGAWMSPFVLILMYVLAPVAWPTAKLLDWLLGADHGTTYKKAGLKTLVTLHKSLGEAGEQLNEDEVTIISAVLDLKAKSVGSIMTPMSDVFTMSADTVLDEETMEVILGAGYSRIPIHAPDNPGNFVGMLLVKILITYDPEDAKRVREFALATLPETRAETSCLDIVNFFQEGKSHMVLVSEYPGDDHGALGVVTLEDVIEELIGEEIIDESDVYIDVHKAIRRMAPAPKSRVPKGQIVEAPDDDLTENPENLIDIKEDGDKAPMIARRVPTGDSQNAGKLQPDSARSPKTASKLRRTSSTQHVNGRDIQKMNLPPETLEHLKHLGPSNPASRPRTTRYNTVKVKPGQGAGSDLLPKGTPSSSDGGPRPAPAAQGGVGAGLLTSAGRDAKDGVLALQAGYGSIPSDHPASPKGSRKGALLAHAERSASKTPPQSQSRSQNRSGTTPEGRRRRASVSTLGSMHSGRSPSPRTKRAPARSGSITENIVDTGGIKKTVLELTSSSSDQEANGGGRAAGPASSSSLAVQPLTDGTHEEGGEGGEQERRSGGKKKRRRRKKKGGEFEPLLGSGDGEE